MRGEIIRVEKKWHDDETDRVRESEFNTQALRDLTWSLHTQSRLSGVYGQKSGTRRINIHLIVSLFSSSLPLDSLYLMHPSYTHKRPVRPSFLSRTGLLNLETLYRSKPPTFQLPQASFPLSISPLRKSEVGC